MPIVAALALSAGRSAAQTATAEDITWSSNFLAPANLDSTGAGLDAGCTFFLGAFHAGGVPFTPTPSNTAEWAAHWITVDAVRYNTFASNFASSCPAPALAEGVSLVGKRGYIWGVRRSYPADEWILLTNASWVWSAPGGGGPGSFGASWLASGSTAVLGQVDVGGVHLRMAAVTGALPPLLRAGIWQGAHFTAEEIAVQESTVAGWLADPNGNGRQNVLEFALGTRPRALQVDREPVAGTVEISGAEYQTLTVTRDPNAAVDLEAEVSADLVNWYSDASHVVLESETPTSLVFRQLAPRSAANPFGAMRVRATLP